MPHEPSFSHVDGLTLTLNQGATASTKEFWYLNIQKLPFKVSLELTKRELVALHELLAPSVSDGL